MEAPLKSGWINLGGLSLAGDGAREFSGATWVRAGNIGTLCIREFGRETHGSEPKTWVEPTFELASLAEIPTIHAPKSELKAGTDF